MKYTMPRKLITWACLILSLLWIWHQAPRIGIDGQRAFAARGDRIALIAVIMGLCALLLLAHWVIKKARYIRISLDRPSQGESKEESLREPAGEARSLRLEKGIDAALRFVRRGGPAWRLGRHSVYRLPWYVLLGQGEDEQGDLLEASGLRFAQNSTVSGIQAASAPYKWGFADEAVIVDARTAGADEDHHWHCLLRKLRRARKRRPIQGVIVTLDANALLHGDEVCRRTHALHMRERIDAMQQSFGMRLPVYLVVLRCEAVPGFDVFLGDLDSKERQQRWGVALPDQEGLAVPLWSTVFLAGFKQLVQRLHARLIDAMPVQLDAVRSAAAYAFPHHFGKFRQVLGQYLDDAFGHSSYAPDVLVRGVCFTATRPRLVPDGRTAEGYFIDHFLRHELMRDAPSAVRPLGAMRGHILRQCAMLTAVGILALGVGCGMWISYKRNHALLKDMSSANVVLASIADQGFQGEDPWSMLPLLDAARDMLPESGNSHSAVPLSYRFGLYQGDRIGLMAYTHYQALLRQMVQPALAARLDEALRNVSIDQATRYRLLKIYLMLGDKSHYDPATVMTWIQSEVRRWPGSPAKQEDFISHADALFGSRTFAANMPLDKALIDKTRATLTNYPLAERLFDEASVQLASAGLKPLTVAEMGGPDTALVMYRKSGQPLSSGVPGAYTLAGYHRYVAIRHVILERADQEDWVTGQARLAEGPSQLAAVVEQMDRYYLNQYMAAWDAVIDDVALKPLPASKDGAAMLALLAQTASPLQSFLQTIATQTALDAAQPEKGAKPKTDATLFGRLGKLLDGRVTVLQDTEVVDKNGDPGVDIRPVTQHYDALRRLMVSPEKGGATPLYEVQQRLKDAALLLDTVSKARARGLPVPQNDALTKLDQMALGLPPPLPEMLGSLSTDAVAMTSEDERAQLNQVWQARVLPFCKAAISDRYPFNRSSTNDVTLDDFTRLFGPDGLIDTFFQSNLLRYVDTTSSPWRWRAKITPDGISSQALKMFEQAEAIREVFFPGHSKVVRIPFTLVPESMDAGLTRLVIDLDNQVLDYSHGPLQPSAFVWPRFDSAQIARIEYETIGGQGGMLTAAGPWALFRLFDKATLQKQQENSFNLILSLGKNTAKLKLSAGSVLNPFGLSMIHAFHCSNTL